MAESPIQQFLDYRYRKWIVGGATILLMLMVSLPAYERVSRIRVETKDLTEEIEEVCQSLVNLEPLRERASKITTSARRQTVDDETALKLREKVVRLIHDLGCRLLSIELKKSQSTPWSEGDDPLIVKTSVGTEESGYQLLRTQLSLSAEGSLPRITQLLEELANLHEFAVPSSMHLQQKGDDGTLQIEIEMSLLDLKRDTGQITD